MDETQIDFKSDINKFSDNKNKLVRINNLDINLNSLYYENKNLLEVFQKWLTCFEILGKGNLFRSKSIIKILYCLLTDCSSIITINNIKTELDLYDESLERFLRIEVIDKNNRFIKIKIFPICDSMVIIDCSDFKSYKIYELHNLQLIKKCYGTNKINFDLIKNNIGIYPTFIGNITNLQNDFKCLSCKN